MKSPVFSETPPQTSNIGANCQKGPGQQAGGITPPTSGNKNTKPTNQAAGIAANGDQNQFQANARAAAIAQAQAKQEAIKKAQGGK